MKDSLTRLQKCDPATYDRVFNWLKNIVWDLIKEDPERYFLERGPYPLRDAILQACLQEAIAANKWFFYIQWDTHYGWLASINEAEEPCEGDTPAAALLAAYVAAKEADLDKV